MVELKACRGLENPHHIYATHTGLSLLVEDISTPNHMYDVTFRYDTAAEGTRYHGIHFMFVLTYLEPALLCAIPWPSFKNQVREYGSAACGLFTAQPASDLMSAGTRRYGPPL